MVPSDHLAKSAGITISALHKNYGAITVMRDVSLDIPPGTFVALLGPSGCGKTTLLRMIAGLIEPTAGRITIGGTTVVDVTSSVFVPPQKRKLGMVFQHYALWPHMTVQKNILYPLRKNGVPKGQWMQKVIGALEAVGLPSILERRPAQLSGGQQQRVALARALVSDPNVLLLDEPLSNLDANLREQLRRELRQLHERRGTTTILVTHDQEEAAMLADMIVVMNQGSIVQIGDPHQIIDYPANRFVASFVGYDNFVPVHGQGQGDEARLVFSDGQSISAGADSGTASKLLAFKSGQIALLTKEDTADRVVTAKVTSVLNLGRWRQIKLDLAGTEILLNDKDRVQSPLLPGQAVRLGLPATLPLIPVE